MPGGNAMEDDLVGPEWLLRELRSHNSPSKLLILDCRAHSDFSETHIRGSVPLAIPSIMLRRLAAGKVDLLSTIRCSDLRNRVEVFLCGEESSRGTFVLIGDSTGPAGHQGETIQVLSRRIRNSGGCVAILIGGFGAFRDRYPEWCEGSQASGEGPPGQDANEGPEEDKDFPVEILPHLYLGNAANSEDREALARHRIQYILNVTPDLPNVFENAGSIKYMQIPISDHWSQNLASFFPQAIQFIEEARSSDKGVLVHCLAGVSRSVTITVAYLMHKCSLSLNDAFNLVRSRKSNVAPNFHFMEQLHSFEKELRDRGDRNRGNDQRCIGACRPGGPCNCPAPSFLSPIDLGLSPDSGIEFDRWAASTPAE
ncbi:dual specificity protein phosphatase Mpk3 isoform X2 [Colletes gigas]|uniref:dual specificity protein phosphatase Mpk3 isoform X2 n=1 Tax=Colletes gigas TaxID=935657 RepID=UPI001C9B4A66|nr:dual specificity protein phosphatase Mpk3 isoform X2 [Colletes gigas]